MISYAFKQDDKVYYDLQELKGMGKVVGFAAWGDPVRGKMYIIEPDENIMSQTYPFTHFPCSESYLTRVMTEREMFEQSFKRPKNYRHLSSKEQWEIDKALGILDWNGEGLTEEDRKRMKEHYT